MSSGIGRAVKSRRHAFAIQRALCAERPAARLLSSDQLIEVGLETAARRKTGSKTLGDAGPRSPILRS